jgi:hypothetical protein
LNRKQFLTTAEKWGTYESPEGALGFAIGKSKRVRVDIYDKLTDTMNNHDPVYRQAMIERQWGGQTPAAATRVEWQIGREWIRQHPELESATAALNYLPEIFAAVTRDTYSYFRLVDRVPDRKNRPHDRVDTHPLWKAIVEAAQYAVGDPSRPLTKLNRTSLDERSLLRQIIGCITSIANRRQSMCDSIQDLVRILVEALRNNDFEDSDILGSFERKAKESGTWSELFEFPRREAA